MSEERLDKAIEAMKNEPVDPETVESVGRRVRQAIAAGDSSACLEFRSDFGDYIEGKLAAGRRLLMDDHISRCPRCRAHLAEQKGERKVVPMPERRTYKWARWSAWGAVAAAAVFALYLGRGSLDTLLAPRGPIATVESIDGALYLVPDRVLETGGKIAGGEVVRTALGTHASLRLRDGSLVNLNGGSELYIRGALSGYSIRLQRGDIIVEAAKQGLGRRLQVETRDSLTSVRGTVFAVSSGLSGTLVSVVEGSVAVRYSGNDVLLSPGEQTATNPALKTTVSQAVAWSPEAGTYEGILASLAKVGKQIGELPSPQLRTESRLLQFMPPAMFVYGALPNFGENLDQALAIMEQQAAENADFSRWLDSGSGQSLRTMIGLMQTITPNLGDEIVYGISVPSPATRAGLPVIMAEVGPGRRSRLEEAILAIGSGTVPFSYCLDDTLLVMTDSQPHLDWLKASLGQGASGAFASDIANRYSQGVGWLLGVDMNSLLSVAKDAPEFVRSQQVKRLFIDQRLESGVPENEISVSFNGPRTGLPSFIADYGSGGAAEYISADALAAGYLATREPQQMFEELLAQLYRVDPSVLDKLDEAESRIGINFSNDLAYAFGAESAFSIDGISLSGPIWILAAVVNDAGILDGSIRKLAETVNAELESAGRPPVFAFTQETVNGREWKTLQVGTQKTVAINWTYDRGYMVAGSDRGVVLRAIATRDSGLGLAWSSDFQAQLPASAGLHPSGFFWLNTKGAFEYLAAFVSNPVLKKLVMERDPILVVFDADAEQIRAVSRTRLSSVVMDMLLLQGFGKSGSAQQPAPAL